MRKLTLTIFLLLAFLAARTSTAASFDCSGATNSIERSICANFDLSKLDERLSVVYERALALKSGNLKLRSEQRQWLQSVRNTCTDSTCLKNAYEKRLTTLEAITGPFDSVPLSEQVKVLCHKLSDLKTRQQVLENTTGIEDINNDGQKERTEWCSGGTMRVPCTRYFDIEGKEILINTVGYEWKDFWTYGIRIFRYQGRTYSLHAYDDNLKRLAYLSYVTPSNDEFILCKFDNEVTPVVAFAEEGYGRICEEVLANKGENLEPVAFEKTVKEPKSLPENSWEKLEYSGLVDINNDGRKEWLAELSITSGAGRGCDANKFVFVGEDGSLLRNSAEQRQLDVMQGASSISCGLLSNRMLKIGGKIYFESNVDNNELFQHALLLWSGKDVKTVCTYNTGIRTTVK